MAFTTMYDGKNNSPQTALSAAISASDTTIPVSEVTVFPSAPNLATIGNEENAEVIRYNGISGSTLTGCERGFGGTTAKTWEAESLISRQITKYDFDAIIANLNLLDHLFAAEFNDQLNYAIGAYVTYNGDLYRFTSAHSAGAWDSSEVTAVTVAEELALRELSTNLKAMAYKDDADSDDKAYARRNGGWYDLDNRYYTESEMDESLAEKADNDIVAEEFSNSTAYSAGQYVIYQGVLYRFTSAHSAGAWDSSEVTAVTAMDEVSSIIQESAFTVTESGGLWYLNWFGAENTCPYSVSLVGTDYVLYFEY